MINSIYTNKEIFLRELVSNCSDAIDKLYFKGLKEGLSGLTRNDFAITVIADKDKRTLTISDNGIGMNKEDLENNLGTIARSGSLAFKTENADGLKADDLSVIGQFGVGFYSAFMVADKVEVCSKAYGEETAYLWVSKGTEGYDVLPAQKESHGTDIVLYLKPDTDDDNFSRYLEEYEIRSLIKKYSDYIRYPIKTEVTEYKDLTEEEEKEGKQRESVKVLKTLNSMTPLWKKSKSEVTKEEYDGFYKDTFFDYEPPCKQIHVAVEGSVNYKALLYIPSKIPYDFYSKNYEKGLKLYTDGVLITDKCADLLPDYFSFVKGVVDSELTLNISRETIQQSRQLKVIGSNIEKKIKSELLNMLKNERESYEKFFDNFGLQLKYGVYSGFGMNKELLQDLLMFKSATDGKYITLKEYADSLSEDDKFIYYGSAKTVDGVKNLPQSANLLESGKNVLCFTDEVDEFAIKMIGEYQGKTFKNVLSESVLDSDDEKINLENKGLLDEITASLDGKVAKVKLSSALKNRPVSLSSEGEISLEMERVLSRMPNGGNGVKAEKVLEISPCHPIFEKIKKVYLEQKEQVKDYAEVLFALASLSLGLEVENLGLTSEKIIEMLAR